MKKKNAIIPITALLLIINLYSDSLRITHYFHKNPYDNSLNNAILVAHGLWDDHRQAYEYMKQFPFETEEQKNRYIHEDSFVAMRFADAARGIKKLFKAPKASLGQAHELDYMTTAYRNHLANYQSILLHGISRGTAAVVNFVARENPTNISGILLEAPFDSVPGLVDSQIKSKKIRRAAYWLICKLFKKFSKNKEHPNQQIYNIVNKNLPILIVCSKKDKIVPWTSSLALYKQFKEAGFDHAYILILDKGKHAKALWKENGELYQNVVHAFKERYAIGSYNPNFAKNGRKQLDLARVSLKRCDELLEKYIKN